MYSYRIYYQIQNIFCQKVLHLYYSVDVDSIYNSVYVNKRYYHVMIGRIYYSDAQYLTALFSMNVFYSWIDCLWNVDFQNIYKIQRNKTTRNAHKFLNGTLSLLTHHLYICYGSLDSRSDYLDSLLGSWIYDISYEG